MTTPQPDGGVLRATLLGHQIRLFKAAITFLHKLGPELLVEAFPDRLILRAHSPSKAAAGAVTLPAGTPGLGAGAAGPVFSSYEVFDAATVRAALPAKHVLAALRTARPPRLSLEIRGGGGGAEGGGRASSPPHSPDDAGGAALTIHSESGLVKSFRFGCTGSEVLAANVDAAALPYGFTASVAELGTLLGAVVGAGGGGGGVSVSAGAPGGGAPSSSTASHGVTLVVSSSAPDGSGGPAVEVRSYADRGRAGAGGGGAGPARTAVSVAAGAGVYGVSSPPSGSAADVTLAARDLRALLPLADALGGDVAIAFGPPGAPLVAAPVPKPGGYGGATATHPHAPPALGHLAASVDLVLATLFESQLVAPPTPAASAGGGRQQWAAAPPPGAPAPAPAAPPTTAMAPLGPGAFTGGGGVTGFDDEDDEEEEEVPATAPDGRGDSGGPHQPTPGGAGPTAGRYRATPAFAGGGGGGGGSGLDDDDDEVAGTPAG